MPRFVKKPVEIEAMRFVKLEGSNAVFDNGMPDGDWLDRLHEECEQLSDRVQKLEAFISPHGTFGTLPDTDQTLLNAQLGAMKAYQYVLLMRLDRAECGPVEKVVQPS